MKAREINIDLLEKAARKLVAEWPEDKFNMGSFIQTQNPRIGPIKTTATIEETEKPFCGTAACFAGAMPWLGIPGLEPIEEDALAVIEGERLLDFHEYSERVLGTKDEGVWNFIFGQDWPNDRQEVLGRVLFLKHHGVPVGFDAETFDHGCGPIALNVYGVSYKEYINPQPPTC